MRIAGIMACIGLIAALSAIGEDVPRNAGGISFFGRPLIVPKRATPIEHLPAIEHTQRQPCSTN
jgi:hypothetical protein